MRPGRRQGGFTLIEILVSLVVVVIGLLGSIALLRTTGRVTRLARQLATATSAAGQVMEDLRASDLMTLPASGAYADVVGSDGTTYHQSYTVAPLGGSATVRLLTATATFADEDDGAAHTVSLQLVRTTMEKL